MGEIIKKERGEPPNFFSQLVRLKNRWVENFCWKHLLFNWRADCDCSRRAYLIVRSTLVSGDQLNHILYYFNPSSDYFANNVSIAAVKMYAMAKPYAM